MTKWYLWDGVEQRGPMDLGELKARIRSCPGSDMLRVWTEGLSEWKRIEEALGPAFATAPPPPPLPPETIGAPEPARAQNFAARHWRGEYPLWAAYWVVGFASNVAATIAIFLLSQFMVTQVAYVPLALWLFFAAIWSGMACLGVWQAVGIWRSATRRRIERHAAGKRAPWAVAAKIAVCLGALQLGAVLLTAGVPQVVEATRMAFMGDPSIPSYAVRAMNNGTEAEISGGIKYGVTADLEKLLQEFPAVRVLHLDSVGGRIGEGKKLNALIRARNLDTYVETKCMSACTLAFAAGRQRILRKGAVLGFHRGAFPGSQSNEIGSGTERTIYGAAGFSKAFIERALATKNSDMWKPDAQELLSAKVVTRLSSGDEFAMGGYGGTLSAEQWDGSLDKATPAYGAIKRKYPADYAEILDIFVKETAKGTPRAVVTGKARARFNALIKTLLPQADDAVLIEYGRLVVDEYRALQARDPNACYKFASGTDVDETVIGMIPPDLTSRETRLYEKIVLSARKRDKDGNTDDAWIGIRDKLLAKGYSNAELRAMGSKDVPPSSWARYCAMTIDMYTEIVGLPAKDAGILLRDMFADG